MHPALKWILAVWYCMGSNWSKQAVRSSL